MLPRQVLFIIYKSFKIPYNVMVTSFMNNLTTKVWSKKIKIFNLKQLLKYLMQQGEHPKQKFMKKQVLSLKLRQWWRIFCRLYKVKKSGLSLHLSKYMPRRNYYYYNIQLNERARPKNTIVEQMFSNIHFFPFAFSEWNRLDLHIRKTSSLLSFKNFQLKLGQHVLNSHFK